MMTRRDQKTRQQQVMVGASDDRQGVSILNRRVVEVHFRQQQGGQEVLVEHLMGVSRISVNITPQDEAYCLR